MAKKQKLDETASAQLRAAVDAYKSRYALCRDSGVDKGALSRFMAGNPITTDTVDKLCKALGLEFAKKRGK